MIQGTFGLIGMVAYVVVFIAGYMSLSKFIDYTWIPKKIGLPSVVFCLIFAYTGYNGASTVASVIVAKKIPHVWEEKVLNKWSVSDLKVAKSDQNREVEILQFAINTYDKTKSTGGYSSSNNVYFVSDKVKANTVEKLQKVRVYKNKDDEKFYRSNSDFLSPYYVVYTNT